MALYKIVDIFIEADYMPANYHPFRTTESPCKSRLIKIIRSEESEFIPNLKVVASLDIIDVSRSPIFPHSWIYKFKIGLGTLIVSDDYSCVECRFCKDSISQDVKNEVLDTLIHLAIQCKLIHESYSILHAACISINNQAIALSGPSGIGKSTRASLMANIFSAEWISGDRPIINSSTATVFGAPWDGSDKIYKNINKPLQAILKIKRSTETSITEMTYLEKYHFLTQQVFIPMWDKDLAIKALTSIKKIANTISIYQADCDRTESSMKELYKLLSNVDKSNTTF